MLDCTQTYAHTKSPTSGFSHCIYILGVYNVYRKTIDAATNASESEHKQHAHIRLAQVKAAHPQNAARAQQLLDIPTDTLNARLNTNAIVCGYRMPWPPLSQQSRHRERESEKER